MKWAVIATWKMSEEGNRIASKILKDGGTCAEAAIEGICNVEDNPDFHSVGYGGRPDSNCEVYLDGGFMDGNTLHFGAVGAVQGYRSAVRIAHSLVERDANNFLVGKGAEEYAEKNGFEKRDNLTEPMIELYEKEKERRKALKAYDGHDTVCFLVRDISGSLCAATSTSGLFMKDRGRLGDTPVPGSGFYADSDIGAAAATGMGEEIMKGCLSYAAVQNLRIGMSAQEAAETAVKDLHEKLMRKNGSADAMSLICMDREGNWGVGTNVNFPFTVSDDMHGMKTLTARWQEGKVVISEE